jgi:hypothetical protein
MYWHHLHSWTYAELASHLLIPLVFLMYCLGAPELLLRKAIALELLVLFVRFMFIARAVPELGPMITMLVKVSTLGLLERMWMSFAQLSWQIPEVAAQIQRAHASQAARMQLTCARPSHPFRWPGT